MNDAILCHSRVADVADTAPAPIIFGEIKGHLNARYLHEIDWSTTTVKASTLCIADNVLLLE